MTLRRRAALAGLAATLALPLRQAAAGPALTVLIGAYEGSGTDQAARDFLEFLAPRLPDFALQPKNRPGDGGRAMLTELGHGQGAGPMLGWVVTPTLGARMIDRSDLGLLRNITLLGQVEQEPIAFVSPASDPSTTVQDIIRRAADDADAVPLGTPPAGSPPFLAALRVQDLAQTRLNIVTFPSPQAALQAVLAGNVSAAALGLSVAFSDIRDGNLTAIGIAAHRRFGLLPDTPVLDEGGIPLKAFIRRGFAVPAGTPAALVEHLTDAIREASLDEGLRDKAQAAGYYAAWEDATTWLAAAEAEQAILTKLWQTDPWLSSSGE